MSIYPLAEFSAATRRWTYARQHSSIMSIVSRRSSSMRTIMVGSYKETKKNYGMKRDRSGKVLNSSSIPEIAWKAVQWESLLDRRTGKVECDHAKGARSKVEEVLKEGEERYETTRHCQVGSMAWWCNFETSREKLNLKRSCRGSRRLNQGIYQCCEERCNTAWRNLVDVEEE